MITQVLIVHGQLPFAITLKQTLERGAPFEAHPFTSVEAAGEYLRDHVQDVAVVDFAIPDFPGDQIVQFLREIQPNITIVATPRLDDDATRALNVQGSIKSGFTARDLINLLNAYFADHDRPTFVPPRNTTTGLLGRLQTREHAAVPPPPAQPPQPKPLQPSETRNLNEYSSLDHVLSSAGATNIFGEPPVMPGDTPAGGIEDIAWAHEEPPRVDSSFEDVLSAIPTDTSPADNAAPRNPFTDLVNSMRSEEAHRPLPSRQEQFVEFILTGGMDSLLEEIEQSQASSPPPETSPSSLFERLALEEPPPPTFEESGTVGDLVTGVQDRSFRNVLSILRGEEIQDSEPMLSPPTAADFDVGPRVRAERTQAGHAFFADEDEPTPARVILQRALEEQVTGEEFSLEELLQSIEQQFPQSGPRILPSPTWLRDEQSTRENAFMVKEPDFLPEELPPEPTPSGELYPNQTTQPSRGQQIEANPESLETEWLEDRQPVADDTAHFPRTLPEEIPADATIMHQPVSQDTSVSSETSQLWHELPDQDFNTQFELMAAFEVHDEKGMSSGALYTEVPVESPATDEVEQEDSWDEPLPAVPEPPARQIQPVQPTLEDPYLAQLALSLTEASLELSAEATLLARDGQIVAFAGQMSEEEVEELRGAIADDWNAAPGEVRIRFLTARGSGKDYMLYSRRTEDDFTLSLIFAGTTPLRVIRRQGQRLVDALLAVPEPGTAARPETARTQAPVSAPVQKPPVDTAVRTPYAFVWLLADPTTRLDPTVSQAITVGLNIQMREQHWGIQSLQVRNDHIYMLAEVPGEEPAFKLVREIKRRSAELAHAQNAAYNPAGLWSDGYLVVTPGRELDAEEIQQFITFERLD